MAAYDADAGPQSASRRMDAMRDAVRGAPELLQQRSFETKSLTYDFGRSKEDLEVTQIVDRELENDPVRRIREDAAKILVKKSIKINNLILNSYFLGLSRHFPLECQKC